MLTHIISTTFRATQGKGGKMKYLRFIPFFRDSRATVALEGAMATSFLVFALTGVFEIVNTLLVGDLLNRAAYRVGARQRTGRHRGQQRRRVAHPVPGGCPRRGRRHARL